MSRKRPTLYGPTGQPLATSWDFYESSATWPNRDGDTTSASWTNGAQDTDALLPKDNWQELLHSSRWLFANVPILRGAILDQASLAFPLVAQYAGEDKDWGKRAEEWLWEWRKIADVRGPTYDALTCSRIRLISRRVDGDIGRVLVKGENGYPQLQFIRAHRVGNRSNPKVLEKGVDNRGVRLAGFRCNNGVVVNDQGRPIAYHVLGDKEEEDQFISAFDMFLTYRPDYSDLSRGIPEMCASIQSFSDLKRLREYEMRAQQIGASIGVIEKNETGEEDMASETVLGRKGTSTANTNGTMGALTTRTFEKGMVLYMRANSGSGLEAFRQDRPSADAQAFEDKIVIGAFSGIEWDATFSLAIQEPGGAWARTVIQRIRRIIENIQAVESMALRREDGWAIARAVKEGWLPKPKDGDWYSWEYKTPRQITADSGNEERAKLEKYKIGALTLSKWASEDGDWWKENRAQRSLEVDDLLTRAKVAADKYGLTIQEALHLFEARDPNAPQAQPISEPQQP
jgi:hypothetical protein